MQRNPVLRSLLGATLLALALLVFAGPAGAQSDDYNEQPTSTVQGGSVTQPAVAGSNASRGSGSGSGSASGSGSDGAVESNSTSRDGGSMPVTGSDVVTLALIGGGLVLVGGVALTARRRLTAA